MRKLPTLHSNLSFFNIHQIISIRSWNLHCVKNIKIRSYFWTVFSWIQTEYRKIRTRNKSAFGYFSRSVTFIHCSDIRFTWNQNLAEFYKIEQILVNTSKRFLSFSARKIFFQIRDIQFMSDIHTCMCVSWGKKR